MIFGTPVTFWPFPGDLIGSEFPRNISIFLGMLECFAVGELRAVLSLVGVWSRLANGEYH